MAGLRTASVSMRDLPQSGPSDFSSWVQSLDESKQGNLNPGDPAHREFISSILGAVESGQATPEDVNKLARLNNGIAPLLFTSLSNANQKRDVYGKYFQPEQTALPEQSGLTLNVPGGTMEATLAGREATPAKADTTGAVTELLSKGNVAEAKELLSLKIGGGGESTPFAKINPKDFSQASVAKFEKTNRYSDLVPTEDTKGDSDKAFEHASKLRAEFNALSKPFMEVRDSFGRIEESAKNPSAAGDLALIFNYMKMLDPGSTVREGEFATAQNSGGIPDRIRSRYNNVLNGERLSTTIRDDFTSRAKSLFERQKQTHKKLEDQYRALSKRVGVDENQVVTDFGYEPLKEPQKDSAASRNIKQQLLDELRK